MKILPSLDLEGGRVVKRVEGVRGTGLIVGDPREVAAGLERRGIREVHVVDLDGAEQGRPVNTSVARLLVSMGFRVQYGGGIRSIDHARLLLEDIGVDRIVVGTLFARNPSLVERMVSEYGGERIVVSLDARWGVVMVEGWRREARSLWDLVHTALEMGVRGILYTSIEREGRLLGPDTERVKWLRGVWPYELQYAGGVSSLDDILVLAELGVNAAILGMAFHLGLVDPGEASMLAARV